MRYASHSPDFPYELSTMCYLEVAADGSVQSPPADGVAGRVRAGESRLYAVWPGKYRSDLFLIDDIDDYEKALGIQHDPVRTGLADHEHRISWQLSPHEQHPAASYVFVDTALDCGCEIKDLKAFARQAREQLGWDVATTGGVSTSVRFGADGERQGLNYTLRIRRKSLG
ncbi:hypothetical protein AB0H36_29075 [Kribbella sp. NPDC050820]|uniref:hypothetical protein n=1 Tax=Kribbella sp. NPDC050820 TaxID=3155408 RepID=UPI003404706F